MIFLECVGSRACLSAKGCKSNNSLIYILFYTLFYIQECKIGYLFFHLYYNWAFMNKLTNKSTLKN